jgi:hypothetical protein
MRARLRGPPTRGSCQAAASSSASQARRQQRGSLAANGNPLLLDASQSAPSCQARARCVGRRLAVPERPPARELRAGAGRCWPPGRARRAADRAREPRRIERSRTAVRLGAELPGPPGRGRLWRERAQPLLHPSQIARAGRDLTLATRELEFRAMAAPLEPAQPGRLDEPAPPDPGAELTLSPRAPGR